MPLTLVVSKNADIIDSLKNDCAPLLLQEVNKSIYNVTFILMCIDQLFVVNFTTWVLVGELCPGKIGSLDHKV